MRAGISDAGLRRFGAITVTVLSVALGLTVGEGRPVGAADTLTVTSANWFETGVDTFVALDVVAADATAGNALTVTLDAGPGTAIGDGPSFQLTRVTDGSAYLSHRTPRPVAVSVAPSMARITSTAGGEIETSFNEWLGGTLPAHVAGFQTNFHTNYLSPTEITQRMTALAAEFPGLISLVDLPWQTNGYQRRAQAVTAGSSAVALSFTTTAWGQEGGNGTVVDIVDAAVPNSPLTVSVVGTTVTVTLATDDAGVAISTAAQVVAAVNAAPAAAALLTASGLNGSTGGSGIVVPGSVTLTDGLNAPASVTRGRFQPKLMRIGTFRDGTKPGVLLTAQQAGNDWIGPLVTLEVAERLVRNYAGDPATQQLLDNLDVFVVPTVNPDGGHFSRYDFAAQVKNMTNYCPPSASDFPSRNSWGVNIDRGYSVGSLFDGYTGGSTTCTNVNHSGPFELSEPESRNVVWTVNTFPNIQSAVNIDSADGSSSAAGSATWSPGARSAAASLPALGTGDAIFLNTALTRVLTRLQEERGTTADPVRVGERIHAVASAAGNLVDELTYNHGLRSLNLVTGAARWSGSVWATEGNQPPWPSGGEAQVMEYSDAVFGFLEAALNLELDETAPVITPVDDSVLSTSDPAGAAAAFDIPTATDDVDGNVPVTCSRPSGFLFPLGDSAVTCTATDAKGNTSTSSFTVTVLRIGTITCPATARIGETVSCTFANGPSNRLLNVEAQINPVIAAFDVTSDASGAADISFSLPTGFDPGRTVSVTVSAEAVPVGSTTFTLAAPATTSSSTTTTIEPTTIATTTIPSEVSTTSPAPGPPTGTLPDTGSDIERGLTLGALSILAGAMAVGFVALSRRRI